MAVRKHHYSFEGQDFAEIPAHGGDLKIRTVRVADESRHQGFNFIDLTEIPPGHSIGIHRHGAEDEEVYIVICGTGTMSVENERFEVHSGDVVVNPASGEHGLVNTGDKTLRLVVLDVPVSMLSAH
jgi:mannose-6-phosphate isomerase-like protein (cupin superfamily)